MKKIVNLTPHPLVIKKVDGSLEKIAPTGSIARVASKTEIVGEVNGISIFKQTFGEVLDLPEAQDDVILVVSRMVKDKVPSRDDVLVPGALLRDSEGNIIGANGLSL